MAALELLSDLVPQQRLWIVGDGAPPEAGRQLYTPCERGGVPETLLALTSIIVEDPRAIILLATPHCLVVPRKSILEAVGAAYLERSPGKAPDSLRGGRPIVVGEGREAGVVVACAENLLRSFARAMPRLTRLFTYAALMNGEERERFLLQSFSGLPRLCLSADLLRGTRCPVGRPYRPSVAGRHARSGLRATLHSARLCSSSAQSMPSST